MKSLEQFKILFAGCSDRAEMWIEYILGREDCSVVGLLDINEQSALNLAEKYSLTDVSVYSNAERAFDALTPDLVIDTVSNDVHVKLVSSALLAGSHVMGETFIAENAKDFDDILNALEITGNRYLQMYSTRYNDGIEVIRGILGSAILGNILVVNADFYLKNFENYDYINAFDIVRCFCGEPTFSDDNSANKTGEFILSCSFIMQNGASCSLRFCNCVNGLQSSQYGQWKIICEFGTIHWDGVNLPFYELLTQEEIDMGLPGKMIRPEVQRNSLSDKVLCMEEMFSALKSGELSQTEFLNSVNNIYMYIKAFSVQEQNPQNPN